MAKTQTRRSAKVDPVIALVATADRVLDEYVKISNAIDAASAKLAPGDRYGLPSVPPPESLNVLRSSLWPSDFLFTSQRMIDQQFRLVTKRLKGPIAANKLVLAILPKLKGPLEKKFRAEQRRMLAVQRKAGLIELHKRERKAWMALHDVTGQIAKAKPTTAAGALAMVRYVQWRTWGDYGDLFSDHPAQFDKVLRTAVQRLQRSIAA